MVRCYYCGREVEDETGIIMKDINVGFLELSHERHSFHPDCWKTRQKEERRRTLKQLAGIFIICFLIVFFLYPGIFWLLI